MITIKKKFAFYNFKGGTGKTSICFQVATHIALMGYNVLVIDTDPQGHLSTSCGFPNDDSFLTLYDFLIRKINSDICKCFGTKYLLLVGSSNNPLLSFLFFY